MNKFGRRRYWCPFCRDRGIFEADRESDKCPNCGERSKVFPIPEKPWIVPKERILARREQRELDAQWEVRNQTLANALARLEMEDPAARIVKETKPKKRPVGKSVRHDLEAGLRAGSILLGKNPIKDKDKGVKGKK